MLDTCVLSEARKKQADKGLIEWLNSIDESRLYISVVTLAEIQKGIAKLSDKKYMQSLQTWLDENLVNRFAQRIIEIDTETSLQWGLLLGESEKKGNKLPLLDSLIAACAIQHNQILVTRNISDFQSMPVKLHNPWSA